METQMHSGLFSPGGCLTAQTLRRYLDNTLRPAEKLWVEEHLRHCMVCKEALDGFKRHRSDDFMQSDLEYLSRKIKRRYSSKRSSKQGIPVTIVFSLFIFLIILLVVYFLIRYLLLSQ